MSKEAMRAAVEALTYARACLAPYLVNTGKIDAALSLLRAELEAGGEPVAQIRGGDLYWLVAGDEKLPEGALLYAFPVAADTQGDAKT